MTLIDPHGDSRISAEERERQLDELVDLTSDEGLKRLIKVKTLQEAQKLWLSGQVTSEQLTVFVLGGISLEMNILRRMISSLGVSVMPRPGGGF